MYEPGRHYAKQNKPDTERQMLCNPTHLYIEPEIIKLIDAKNLLTGKDPDARKD